MNLLFSKSSLMILESLSFTRTLYAFDFDGTLCRIVSTPAEARLTETTRLLLQRLSQLVPLAIVSGRSCEDLKQKLGFQPQYLVGNHGLEGLASSEECLKQAKTYSEQWKKQLLRMDLCSGIDLEDKIYSLALHYRRSRNKKQDKELIQKVVTSLTPVPHLITGKLVYNLLPPKAPHKGAAILELMKNSQMKHAFYIGDDKTDEDVFGLSDSQIMTVRVGKKTTSQACYYIERQSEINRILKLLIQYHEVFHIGNSGRSRYSS